MPLMEAVTRLEMLAPKPWIWVEEIAASAAVERTEMSAVESSPILAEVRPLIWAAESTLACAVVRSEASRVVRPASWAEVKPAKAAAVTAVMSAPRPERPAVVRPAS